MQTFAIIGLCIGASIVYGILHDQITARICVEYFTVGHPPIFGTDSPTLLAFGWGIIATWWVGLILGVPLAIAARAGDRPKRGTRTLVRLIARLLFVMAASALAAGIVGFLLAQGGVLILAEPFASRLPDDRHARFLAAGAAHLTSYGVGFLGGLVVIARVWRSRRVTPTPAPAPRPSGS